MKILACIFLALALSSCTVTETPKEPRWNNFSALRSALDKRDPEKFCQALSRSSRNALGKFCQRGSGKVWRELDELFLGSRPLRESNGIFFLQKEGTVLSYPLRKEGGDWKADIVRRGPWK